MYLTDLSAEQLDVPDGPQGWCKVRVIWAYGNQLPDVLQLYYQPGGGSNWVAWDELEVQDATDPTDYEGYLLGPDVVQIIAAPRMRQDDGTLANTQPDDGGEEYRWHDFHRSVQLPLRVEQPGEVEQTCRVPPEIVELAVGFGTVTMRWTNPERYNKFRVTWTQSSTYEADTTDQHLVISRVEGGRTIHMAVKGIHERHLEADCSSDWSRRRETYVPDERGYAPPRFDRSSSLAAISRDSDFMDVFASGPDGRIRSIWWNGGWHPWFELPVGPGFFPNPAVSAVSRDTDFMDIFATSFEGRVHVAWWNGNPWRGWDPIGDAAFEPGAPVAPLSRDTDFMDIFAVGRDGIVRVAWWNGPPWRGWSPLDGASFPPSAPIATLSRHSDHMEIFAVDEAGGLRGNWWNGNPWRGWYALPGESFPAGASVAAVSRHEGHMEVFVVGNDGVVRGNWFRDGWRGWFRLDGAIFEPGTPLAVLSRSPDHMEIFGVDGSGRGIRHHWNGNWNGWADLGSPLRSWMPSLQPPIAAVSRNSDQMDIFAFSRVPDPGPLQSTWFNLTWRAWLEPR